MKHFTPFRIKAALALLFLAGVAVILSNFWSRLSFPNDYRFYDDDGNENLVPGEPIAQKFTATSDNLRQVNLLLGNLEKIESGERLVVEIRDADCRDVIRTAAHHWPSHAPKQYDRFQFEPIPDSEGREYCLAVTYEASEKRKSRPYVKKEKKTGNDTDFFVNLVSGEIFEQEHLIFRPAYGMGSPGADYQELNRRMSAYKAWFLKDLWLSAIFGAFLVLTLVTTLALILMPDEKPKDRE